jgi:hypothetical protein
VRAHFQLAPGYQQPPRVDVFFCPGYELYVTPLPQGELLVAGLAYAEAVRGPIEVEFQRWCKLHHRLPHN